MPHQVTREGAPSRVLFLASNPTKMKFGFAEELHRIEEARRSRPGCFDVIPRWSVSLSGLKRHVTSDRPTVVHVLSPTVDPAKNELVLSDESGEPEYVPSAAFAKAFAESRRPPRGADAVRRRSYQRSVTMAFETLDDFGVKLGSIPLRKGCAVETCRVEAD